MLFEEMADMVVALVATTGILGYFWRRQANMDARLLDTYSKEETDQQIALRTKPMLDAVAENTAAVKELTLTLVALRLSMVEVRSDVRHIKEEQSRSAER